MYLSVSKCLNMIAAALALLCWAYWTRKSANWFTVGWYFLDSTQWFYMYHKNIQ